MRHRQDAGAGLRRPAAGKAPQRRHLRTAHRLVRVDACHAGQARTVVVVELTHRQRESMGLLRCRTRGDGQGLLEEPGTA
jgi:hypothetical protein